MSTPSRLSNRRVAQMSRGALAVLAGILLVATPPVTGEVVRFEAATDTIQVDGDSFATFEFTLEARVRRLSCGPISGRIYEEQADAFEDKTLYVTQGTIGAGAWTDLTYSTLQADTELIAGRWYHLAFVRDGNEERLYLEGEIKASRIVNPAISNAERSRRTLGAFQYAGAPSTSPALGCQVDFLRVSDSVRYTGSAFAPPSEADLVSDDNTQLLYFFDEASGAAVVQDASAGEHDGLVGVGDFGGASSPTLGAEAVCQGDIDGSCSVGFGDVTELLAAWGPCQGHCPGDVDGSGSVGFGDLTALLASWGPCAMSL